MSDEAASNENATVPKIPPVPVRVPPMPEGVRGNEDRGGSPGRGGGLFASFARDFEPLDGPVSMLSVADALLKSPLRVTSSSTCG
jgi:hypothetical protein